MTTNDALDSILQGHNTFIHGQGGTGKSQLINTLSMLLGDDTVLLCPTGVSAMNIKGSTYHSIFSLKTHLVDLESIKGAGKKAYNLFGVKSPVSRVIIDEIGMMRCDHFLQIDRALKKIRRNNLPFGGLQVIFVGDFLQVGAILNRDEREMYFKYYETIHPFRSPLWRELNFNNIFLTEVHRQSDPVFKKALGMIRVGSVSKNLLDYLNNRVQKCPDGVMTLCMTNKTAEKINSKKLSELSGQSKVYTADYKNYKERPAPLKLELKVGAKVLVCHNSTFVNPKGEEISYVNGDTGVVMALLKNSVRIELDRTYDEVEIEPYKYSRIESYIKEEEGIKSLKNKEIGYYEQIPIRLLYASNINKVQGMTLPRIHLDLEWGTFCDGQLYVGLSRVKTYEGLTLERPIRGSDVKVSREVIRFLKELTRG